MPRPERRSVTDELRRAVAAIEAGGGRAKGEAVSLGHPALDAALPWRGLPAAGLHEVLGPHEDHLAAVISADRQETLDLLRQDAPVLERALREAGGSSQGADLRFVHADGGGQSQAEGRAPTNAFLRVPRSLAEDVGAEALPPAAFHQPVWLPGSSLDVRA